MSTEASVGTCRMGPAAGEWDRGQRAGGRGGSAAKSKLGKDTARGSMVDACKLAMASCVIERTGIREKMDNGK